MSAASQHLILGLTALASFLSILALGFRFAPASRLFGRAVQVLGGGPQARIVLYAAFVLAAAGLFDLVLMLTTGWSALWMTVVWALRPGHDENDSWQIMSAALDYWRTHNGDLYGLFLVEKVKFQYPPTSLLPWFVVEAAGLGTNYVALNMISRVAVAASAAAVGALAWVLLGRSQNPAPPRARLVLAVLCAGACFLFYPLTKAWWLGQVQVWMNTAFAFACLAWCLGAQRAAGALIGAIVLIKPQFALFLLWGLLRRDWRFTGAFLAVVAVCGGFSLAIFGLDTHLRYLDVLSVLSRHGESYFNNQSLNGVLNRLLQNGPNLTFSGDGFAPFNPVVYAATLLSTLTLVSAALWPRRSDAGVFDFMIAGLCFTAASPIAWEHHYGVLAPMLAALFCWLAGRTETTKNDWLIFGAAAFATGMSLEFVNALAPTPFNLVQSHLYFGALLLLALLWRARGEASAEPAPDFQWNMLPAPVKLAEWTRTGF